MFCGFALGLVADWLLVLCRFGCVDCSYLLFTWFWCLIVLICTILLFCFYLLVSGLFGLFAFVYCGWC